MHKLYIQSLVLENYRNFGVFELKVTDSPVILIGENGSGKTNILEAISLFTPGRGLRSAKLSEICRNGTPHCSAGVLMQGKLGPASISTNFKLETTKRIMEFNGTKIKNNELSKFSSMAWLTPQMDGIFTASASDRRKFFDRIVYNFIHEHATLVSKYEYYLHERNQILAQELVNESWLKVIEEKMAELSVGIASNRLEILENIQGAINDLDNEFPKATLAISGAVEQQVIERGTNNITDFITQGLASMRFRDKVSGRTNFGVHKSDFEVIHKEKNTLVKLCSTGEQKAMLIAIMLAEVNHSIKTNIARPILLLDELCVHLDNRRKHYLTDFFLESGIQFWVTATDLGGIEKLAKNAEVIQLK